MIVIIWEFCGHISHVNLSYTRVGSKRNLKSSQKLNFTSLSQKMDENEQSSVVMNDSEDSNVGEGLINCYGSPVGRIAVSHRNTALPGTSQEGSRVIDFGNNCQ